MDDPGTQAAQTGAAAVETIRGHIDYLGTALATWDARSDSQAGRACQARRRRRHRRDRRRPGRAARDTAAPRLEIRASDDATAARVDELLARARPAALSPRGRHEAGSGLPEDEPWTRTPDRAVWRAYKGGLVLTVTRLAGGGWQAAVEGPGVTERSPMLFRTRKRAQAWADSRAGGAS